MRPRREPSVLARVLGGELRRYREVAELTGDQAATGLGWSASKISRIETAQIVVDIDDLQVMLDLYQVSSSGRARLNELARYADEHRRGWWDSDVSAGMLGRGYSSMIQLESGAKSEYTFVPMLIPGLLQTEAYAREIISSSLVPASETEIMRRVEVRLKRQRELDKHDPLELAVVLDEAVLLRQIGEPEIMREQLSHLTEMVARHSNITFQVLPLASGSHPAMIGGFTILEFPDVIATKVVYLENMTSELFIEGPDEVRLYSESFDILRGRALGPADSIRLITRLASQLK
jgi:transcriptional regulator with XRE-family HTH domain